MDPSPPMLPPAFREVRAFLRASSAGRSARGAHVRRAEMRVDPCGDAPAVGDRPDHQGLAARRVSSGEDPGHACRTGHVSDHVTASVSARPSSATRPVRSGPVKPIARSARSHGMSKSVPGTSRLAPPTSSARAAAIFAMRLPEASATKALVMTEKSRAQPSSCEDDVRRTRGHAGHGFSGMRTSGGFGMSSSCETLFACWRLEVPTQSEPVSPPPMTTTCLPVARIGSWPFASATASPATRRFCWTRKSMANVTPSSSRPGTWRSRGTRAPVHRTTASNRARSSAPPSSAPTSTPVSKAQPSARICATRRSRMFFSILKSGMP